MSDIKSIVKECFNKLNSDMLYAVSGKKKRTGIITRFGHQYIMKF